MSKLIFLLLFHLLLHLFIHSLALGQSLGGQQAFTFLNLPPNAYHNGLAGLGVSAAGDVSSFLSSPALLDSSHSNQAALTLSPYLSGTMLTTVAYGLPTNGRWAAGMQYLHYGTMPLTDAAGNELGSFSAADYALSLSHARTEGNITLGATAKLVGSGIENYQSWAVIADLAGVFKHPKHDFTFGLAVKNAGAFLKRYSPTDQSELPFDVQLGVTFKPRFMPLRFTATLHHVYEWDIVYNDPKLNFTFDANGNRTPKKVTMLEKFARHLAVGAEILLHQNVKLLAGYNHLRRQEMRQPKGGGAAGFSVGLVAQTQRFGFSYAYAVQHVAGGLHAVSFRANL
jgi:hypothetical protein